MWSELKSKWVGGKMKNDLRFYINQIRKKKRVSREEIKMVE